MASREVANGNTTIGGIRTKKIPNQAGRTSHQPFFYLFLNKEYMLSLKRAKGPITSLRNIHKHKIRTNF